MHDGLSQHLCILPWRSLHLEKKQGYFFLAVLCSVSALIYGSIRIPILSSPFIPNLTNVSFYTHYYSPKHNISQYLLIHFCSTLVLIQKMVTATQSQPPWKKEDCMMQSSKFIMPWMVGGYHQICKINIIFIKIVTGSFWWFLWLFCFSLA